MLELYFKNIPSKLSEEKILYQIKNLFYKLGLFTGNNSIVDIRFKENIENL